ncbi:uncharacterized protein PFL1_02276 [Pseudozyma flocculosa PF-1]|uniref:uncharacterized protein n=1 Tax=Pseudozyma flocculosa PF-1 TaxID=1277687 RepID=UPI0004560A46|nr:uncharacterized protein PFL1_02276 [Pseudozyma flocculosa PF-1]EPQ30160.1 hypothetical protein PFL1_02276 [Pseudozyma flocculosa PF-1]
MFRSLLGTRSDASCCRGTRRLGQGPMAGKDRRFWRGIIAHQATGLHVHPMLPLPATISAARSRLTRFAVSLSVACAPDRKELRQEPRRRPSKSTSAYPALPRPTMLRHVVRGIVIRTNAYVRSTSAVVQTSRRPAARSGWASRTAAHQMLHAAPRSSPSFRLVAAARSQSLVTGAGHLRFGGKCGPQVASRADETRQDAAYLGHQRTVTFFSTPSGHPPSPSPCLCRNRRPTAPGYRAETGRWTSRALSSSPDPELLRVPCSAAATRLAAFDWTLI